MHYQTKLKEFFIEGNDQEKSHVLLHITEPSTPSEIKKGYFFAVCELENSQEKEVVKLQNIINEIEESYYEEDVDNSLEEILEKINQQNLLLLKSGATLNCIVGTMIGNELVFSCHGEPLAWLFYKTKSDSHSFMDLLKQGDDTEKKQLFSQLIQGKITSKDYLFIGTKHINNYFSPDRLQKIIVSRPSRQSVEHLQRTLGEIQNNLSFGGLIIKTEKQEAPDKPQITSSQSLNNLFNTQKNTAEILSPSSIPKMRRHPDKEHTSEVLKEYPVNQPNLTKLNNRNQRTVNNDGLSKFWQNFFRITWNILKFLGKGIMWISILIWNIFAFIAKQLMLIFFVITNHQNRRRNIIDNWSKQWQSYKNNFKHLPKSTKALLLSSVFITIIFIFSIFFIRSYQNKIETEDIYQTKVSTINEKLDTMESALIYGNEDTVLTEIENTNNILNTLECKNHEKECKDIKNNLGKIAQKISKIVMVTPIKIVSFNASSTLWGLGKINNTLITYSNNANEILFYDLNTKNTNAETAPNTKGIIDLTIPKENDYALFLTQEGNIAKYNPENKNVETAVISYPNENSSPTSIFSYNRKIYSLDPINNQIYKHDPIQNGFDKGMPWVKEIVNLEEGTDLTIDGDLFALKQNGQIIKLSKGYEEIYQIKKIYPPLENTEKIYSYNDIQYLYVLDSQNKRLIILDKEGNTIKQLTSEVFQKPLDMVIEEASGIAYILDGNTIYKINL